MQTNKKTSIKPTRKIATSKAAKAAKPVVPAAAAPLAGKAADRATAAAAVAAFRSTAASFYSGDSLTIHSRKPGKAADYFSRVKAPTHSTSTASVRDESLLAVIHANNVNGVFCPVKLAADLGVISRLASLGYIAMRGADAIALTRTGAERAALVAKRKA